MLYFIARPDDITVVVDNPDAAEMRSILEAIRELLWTDILNTYKRAAWHDCRIPAILEQLLRENDPRLDDDMYTPRDRRPISCSASSTGCQMNSEAGSAMKNRLHPKH